jgi:hypothetical protein
VIREINLDVYKYTSLVVALVSCGILAIPTWILITLNVLESLDRCMISSLQVQVAGKVSLYVVLTPELPKSAILEREI